VHGIHPEDTVNKPSFAEVYPEIKKRLQGRVVVAHNEPFDRNVLLKSMNDCGIPYSDLQIADRWEDTVRIYRAKGFKPANLAACCERMNIDLNHHEALSDARACAKLYLAK
jgi:DNA polymerase-3 subunit epsilon